MRTKDYLAKSGTFRLSRFRTDDIGDFSSKQAERERWRAYMRAFETAIAATTTEDAPWYIVPADHKWFAHVLIAQVIIEVLESMRLSYPKVSAAKRAELAGVRKALARSRD